MKSIVILLVIFSGTTVSANARQDTAIRDYYRTVHKAGTLICKGKYDEALIRFKNAFSKWKSPFDIDLSNALFAALRTKKTDTALVHLLLRRIQQKGRCVHQEYGKIERYQPFLTAIDEAGCNRVVDTLARYTIQKSMARDQVLRTFSAKELGNSYDSTVIGAIRVLDSVNYHILFRMMKNMYDNGRAAEDDIGMQAIVDMVTILRHAGPWGFTDRDFFSDMVHKGLLDARLVAAVFDDHCISNYRRGEFSSWNKEQHCDPFLRLYGTRKAELYGDLVLIALSDSADNRRAILQTEKNREDFYLPDIYDEAKLIAFANYYREEGFKYGLMFLQREAWGKEREEILLEQKVPYLKYHGKDDYEFDRSFNKPGRTK